MSWRSRTSTANDSCSLGARPVTVSGNLKVDTNPPPVDERALSWLKRQIGIAPTWAAISTHDGEEAVAAEVHAMLLRSAPGLLTIIVPRHPDRAKRWPRICRAWA